MKPSEKPKVLIPLDASKADLGENLQWRNFLKHRHKLPIHIDDKEPIRLNILIPGLYYELTGGPLNVLRFTFLAAKAGINIRWINLDGTGMNFTQMVNHLKNYDGLEEFGKLITSNVWNLMSPNATSIPTNSNDIFMGTLYWTALVAGATQKILNNPNIIYFIQDYECVFFPQSSDLIEVDESYDLPHFAIFSSPMIQDYFRIKKLGVYKYNESLGDSRSFASLPVIKPFELDEDEIVIKNVAKKRQLIVFAREGTPRNAFELTIAAISEAVRINILSPAKWTFVGVGGVNSQPICYLGNRRDACIRMVKNVPESEYKRILSSGDIGLSLTLSPNPSFSVFDFAAAGMIVVTNSFETRNQESFDKIGKNFIVVTPSLNGIIKGISNAVSLLNTMKERPQKSHLNLPNTWNDEKCYGNVLFNKVKQWFNDHQAFPFENEIFET